MAHTHMIGNKLLMISDHTDGDDYGWLVLNDKWRCPKMGRNVVKIINHPQNHRMFMGGMVTINIHQQWVAYDTVEKNHISPKLSKS